MHISQAPTSPKLPEISFEDFLKVDMRIGKIIEVKDFPEARNPSYKLVIDFGEGVGIKKSSAQITDHYDKETLLDKRVMAVVNFPPRQIGKFMSEVLVMGVADSENKVVLFEAHKDVPNGARLI